MPDTLSLSAGVSLGLLAGIVSGVCYLVANGLTRPKDDQGPGHQRCLRGLEDDGVCRRCGGDTRGGIVPCICRYHKPVKFESGAWFLRQVHRAVSLMPWSINTDKLEQIEEEEYDGRDSPGPSQGRELHNVREFLEALSAQLAGGTLEGTRVGPLYDHPAYLPSRDESPSSAASGAGAGTGASGAHVQLKRLVARVVEEAAALPALARYAAEPPPAPTLGADTYEDLLATAILNKVIERYQTENGSGGRSSGIHSASASPTPSEQSSPRSLHSHIHARDISPALREEEDVSDWEEGEATDDALELPRRVPFPEFGGDIVHHDNTDRDFDEVSSSDIQAIDGSWEENWLFQKKKIKTIQSVPVPMLVPNSNTEYRALIGDRDADDTTDLSDNASDQEEEQDEQYKSDAKKVLESKHIIGGKPRADEMDFEPDSLTIIDNDFESDNEQENNVTDAVNNEINDNDVFDEKINVKPLENGHDSIMILGIDSGPLSKTEFSVKEEIHRTLLNGNVNLCFDEIDAKITAINNDDMLDNFSSLKGSTNTLNRHERVGEYEETVTVPVQRYADSLRRKHFDDEPQQIPTRDTDKDVDDLIPGSIAYRERKKWLNYVEMPNNPYSPEAIKKRLSAKSTSSLFDMITAKSKDINEESDEKLDPSTGVVDNDKKTNQEDEIPVKDEAPIKPTLTINGDNSNLTNGTTSDSPNISKDVLAEEVPQYRRYGRDYYVKEAKASSGGRKKGSYSDTSSLSSLNKSTSLDNFDTEFATPVSASSSLSDLEASALHQNIVRAVLSPRNASPNFAINPIFENPDKQNDNADENHATDKRNVGRNANGLLIKQINNIATNQDYTKFAAKESISTISGGNDNEILIEYEDTNEDAVFSAKPAYIDDDDTDKKFEEILESAYSTTQALDAESTEHDEPKSPTNLSVDNSYISSSSLEDSIKIYNVQTGEIVKCKPEDKVSRYETVTDRNDNIDIPDNNNLGETDDKLSENLEVGEETVIIEDNFEEEEDEEELLEKNSEIDDILAQLPKVKELAKKFVSMENLNQEPKLPQPYSWRRRSRENILNGDTMDKAANKHVYMHSLTARSISKEFREELKMSMATPLTVPGGSKEIPDGTEEVIKESSRPGSPLPEPGTIKSKLAFFESLKTRFSNNK